MSIDLFLSALLMAVTYCSLFMCYLSWKRRELPIVVSYGLGLLTSVFYTFGYAFEIVSSTLEEIKFWLKIEYMGIPFGTVIWFIMVLQYTGRQALLSRWRIALLLVVPIVTFIAHYTNDWHHLFYKSMELDESEGFPLVDLVTGPLYKLHVGYSYTFFIIGMVLLLHMYWHAPIYMKKQIAFMIIGSCGPYGVTLIYLIGALYIPIDISPFGFAFSGIFFMWGIYQFNLLKLAPLALKKVFESMQDAVIILDLDHRITSFNQSAKRFMFGFNYKKLIGKSVVPIFSMYPDLVAKIEQEFSTDFKVKISDQANSKFYNVSLSLISDSRQQVVGKMIVLRDITEEVLSEERMLANTRQLSELNTLKDRLFNVIAHDIRDPLAILISLMELMEDEMKDCGNEHEEVMQEMGQQIQNTYTLVESLLDWFRSQRGGMLFNPVPRDLSDVMQKNIYLLQLRSEGKHIQIHSHIPKGMLVLADKEMLDLIIRNLLSNAIKFTEYEGSIHLKADEAEGKIIVSVRDTGTGIAPDQARTLFQEEGMPVSLAGTAGEVGVGLGLTLCREFVRMNGGEIWFESKLGQGSTFYFSIPASS
ncbi:sensor histidine kinase [Paenibacillus agricola]|uniref:histidine kinase n=1 Tax=Paenibacillus agricola TaxID=2716264 RepID=A0ABX0JEU1_9BACL|nr:histidine kinase N-terminal 7TM domain-containing protein [Paenibacillus agricola]NHN33402.1 PAS domain S-box protein [Paenibacillus agricola]